MWCAGGQDLGGRLRRAGGRGPLRRDQPLLPSGPGVHRRLRRHYGASGQVRNGGADPMTNPAEDAVDVWVDALIIGSGGGGMTAAMAAKAAGLDTLLVEKSAFFGGSTALSGGGMWVPGARVQERAGYRPKAEDVLTYLRTITAGLVTEDRLRAYVRTAPEMLDFIERHTDVELAWKPGYSDYFPELPGGSAEGSVINVE